MRTNNLTSYFLVVLLFIGHAFLSRQITKPLMKVSGQESAINLNENFLKVANFGHGRLAGSFLWVITLLEGDQEHYSQKDGNSWMYHRFKGISIYDPNFYENYRYGGQYLSIIKDDLTGAEIIYDKGLQHYPDDLDLNYHSGFHYLFEMQKIEKAEKILEHLLSLPEGPNRFPILPNILAKLKFSKGEQLDGYNLLLEQYNQLPESDYRKTVFFNTLYSMKAKRDLKCLNSGKTTCPTLDLEGNPYKKEKGLFVTKRDLITLKLKFRN